MLGVFLMYYWLGNMTASERAEMWSKITSANPLWITISLIMSVLAHISRAYRWKFMLAPMGYKPKLKNTFIAVMTAYFANTFVLRSGEVLRGVSIQKSEGVPFDKAFGSVISERIADLIMLLLIMTTAIALQSNEVLTYFEQEANPVPTIIFLIVAITGGIVGLRILKRSSNPFIVNIRNFGVNLMEGVQSILKMDNNLAFIGHTLFIWAMYIGMFWVVTFTVPELSDAPLGVILTAFIIGAFAMSATNAGMGLYPLAMGAIFAFFGYQKVDGDTFGSIIWGTQTIFNVILGGICALTLVFNKKQ